MTTTKPGCVHVSVCFNGEEAKQFKAAQKICLIKNATIVRIAANDFCRNVIKKAKKGHIDPDSLENRFA